MKELLQANMGLILTSLGAAYGIYKFWPSLTSLGKWLPESKPSTPTRADAFSALEVLRTHFVGNSRGMKAVQEAGAAFWEDPGA